MRWNLLSSTTVDFSGRFEEYRESLHQFIRERTSHHRARKFGAGFKIMEALHSERIVSKLGQCRVLGGAHAQGFETRAGLFVDTAMGNLIIACE
jgi:hypothetical protein